VSIKRPLHDVMALVVDHVWGAGLGDDPVGYFDEERGAGRFYERRHVGRDGVTIVSGFIDPKNEHCSVTIPGGALERLPGAGIPAVAGLLGHLYAMESRSDDLREGGGASDDDRDDSESEDDVGHGLGSGVPAVGRVFRITRIDWAFDGVPFSVMDCCNAGHKDVRNLRSPVRRGTAHFALGVPVPGEDGDTFEWGSRKSNRRVRAYDRRGPVRLEMEWRREKADLLARDLLALPVDQWATRAMGHLRDFIDFVDRSADVNVSRAPLLPWWAAFVDGVARVKLKVDRVAAAAPARMVAHVKRNAKTMMKLVAAFGSAQFTEWADFHVMVVGKMRLTPRDRREIEEMKRVVEVQPDSLGLFVVMRDRAAAAVASAQSLVDGAALQAASALLRGRQMKLVM
jgi:hypothetical protein